jgi:hypothetical protein
VHLPAVQKVDLHLCPLSFFQNHVRRSLYPILLLSGHIRGYINMNIYIHLHTQENDVGKLPRGERGHKWRMFSIKQYTLYLHQYMD